MILALVAYGLSFVTGAAFLGPESGRIGKAIAVEGPDSPAVAARVNRIVLVSRIELGILLLIVVDMVLKPGQSLSLTSGPINAMVTVLAQQPPPPTS